MLLLGVNDKGLENKGGAFDVRIVDLGLAHGPDDLAHLLLPFLHGPG